jgi:DNA modification methylase
MRPYYQDEAVTIYHGDCREVLTGAELTADAVVTDPPYSSGGFQESGKSSGSIGTRGDATIRFDNLSTRGYQRMMREVFRHMWAVDEAFVFTDWRMWVHTSDAMEDAGWRVRNMLVWDKLQMGMGMPWRNQHELIAYGKRTPGSIVSGKHGNVIGSTRSGNANHPTEKPADIIETLLSNSEARSIVDPFMGSGTTLVAAKNLGRKAIGIEIEERYCEIAAKRCSQGVLDFGGAV